MSGELIELFGAPTGNCLRAAIALEEAAIPYRPRFVDLRRGEHLRPEFQALNAAERVPVLVDHSEADKITLSQSNAIVFYAAEKSPGTLIPVRDARARALVLERYFYFLTDVIAVGHAAFHIGRSADDRTIQALNEQMLQALTFSERFLQTGRYMAGDEFSMADIAALTIARSVSDAVDWEEFPNMRRWFEEVTKRPSVVRGMSAFSWHRS